jgi:hypothetical protein
LTWETFSDFAARRRIVRLSKADETACYTAKIRSTNLKKCSICHFPQNVAITHRFHKAGIPEVVKHAQIGNFFHHVQANMERNKTGSWPKMIDCYLQQVIVGKVSKMPRVMGVESAREARIRTTEHCLHFVFVSYHDDGTIFSG